MFWRVNRWFVLSKLLQPTPHTPQPTPNMSSTANDVAAKLAERANVRKLIEEHRKQLQEEEEQERLEEERLTKELEEMKAEEE